MKLDWEKGGLLINESSAGRFTIYHNEVAVHLWIDPKHRFWGYKQDWYDGPLHDIGLGRFLLVTWRDR